MLWEQGTGGFFFWPQANTGAARIGEQCDFHCASIANPPGSVTAILCLNGQIPAVNKYKKSPAIAGLVERVDPLSDQEAFG